jgi:uncharacterized protein RhaS with RHS repeats
MYYRVRYYAQGLGRFISADTIIASLANPQSLNRYSYVYNNPINNTDPTGHRSTDNCEFGVIDDRCASAPPPPPNSTNTNTPGGSNTTPAGAQNAGDTGGNDKGGGYTP